MGQPSEFDRSYAHILLYPPQPVDMLTPESRRRNFSAKTYATYLEEMRGIHAVGHPLLENFLVWHRTRQYDSVKQCCVFRGGRQQQGQQKTLVVACRHWYKLTDGFWGQLVLTHLPHCDSKYVLPIEKRHLDCMANFVGMIEYLLTWKWVGEGRVSAAGPFSIFHYGFALYG